MSKNKLLIAMSGLFLVLLSCQEPGAVSTTKVAGPGEADYVLGPGGRR